MLLRHSVLLPAMLTSRLAPQHGLLLVSPWETSEAFLFGPVADKGLDPNMDSWPLDQDGIVQILTSGNYSDLNWDGDYDEEDDKIAGAQALRWLPHFGIFDLQRWRSPYHSVRFLLVRNQILRKQWDNEYSVVSATSALKR